MVPPLVREMVAEHKGGVVWPQIIKFHPAPCQADRAKVIKMFERIVVAA